MDLDGFLQGIGRGRVGLSFGQQIIEPRPTNRHGAHGYVYADVYELYVTIYKYLYIKIPSHTYIYICKIKDK